MKLIVALLSLAGIAACGIIVWQYSEFKKLSEEIASAKQATEIKAKKDQLTREDAARIIQDSFTESPAIIAVDIGKVVVVQGSRYKSVLAILNVSGCSRSTIQPFGFGYEDCEVTLKPDINNLASTRVQDSQIVFREQSAFTCDKIPGCRTVYLVAANYKVAQVTGIADAAPNVKSAQYEFNVQWTPVGRAFSVDKEVFGKPRLAGFQKYDDGWRLEGSVFR